MSLAYNYCNGTTLSVFAKGRAFNFERDSVNFKQVLDAVRAGDEDEVARLADAGKAVMSHSGGRVEVRDGVVYYGGEEMHNVITERILDLVSMNLPFDGMASFLENLMENPSKSSVDQLYKFLENKFLPITEDGCFLAYKRVDDNWMDFHSRKFSNKVGNVLEVPRNSVDDNPNNHCSYGFHAGAIEYVENFNSGGHVIVVKINPKDVVSVPTDCNCQKLRTCRYEVVDEYKGNLERPLYTANVNSVCPVESDMDEDDEDDYGYNPSGW